MTVETSLVAVLQAVCARVFPDVAPYGTTRPFVTYQQIGGEVVNYLDPTLPNRKNGYFQINVWSATRAEAAALALAIESALRVATAFVARPLAAPMATHDADVGLYGTAQDFTIWSDW